jgi:tetratricopeptide (TPR) repeat protein
MAALRLLTLATATAAALLGVKITAAAEQVATATGTCGVAINAAGQARVVVNNYCDTTTAATVQRLLDKAAEQERLNRQQAERTGQLERDRDAQARQIQELSAAVQTVTKLASANQAKPADKQAQALLEQGDTSGAIALLGREAAAASANSAALYRQQAALLRLSNTAQALAAIERSLAIEPDNFEAQREAGDLAMDAGKLGSAQHHYSRMLAIARARSTAEPGDSTRQRDLSVSHGRTGDLLSEQGDLGEALRSYQAAMAIAQKLAAAEPSNSQWQRDLSIAHERIGDTLRAQGDLSGALKSYQATMAIRQKLTTADPSNSRWQHDLAMSTWKIGSLQGTSLSNAERRDALVQGLKVLDDLAQRQLLAPAQADWPAMFRKAIAELQ